MYYYHKADENTVEIFESNPDFFLYGNIFEGPKGLQSIAKKSHNFHDVNAKELDHLYRNIPRRKVGPLRRILGIFSTR